MPGVSSEAPSLELLERSDSLVERIEVDGGVADVGILNPMDRPTTPASGAFSGKGFQGFGQVFVGRYSVSLPEPGCVKVIDGDTRGGVFAILVGGSDELGFPQVRLVRDADFLHFPIFP